MSREPTQAEVTKILKARMAAAGLRHADTVDLRTGTMLEQAGLLKRESESQADSELVDIVSNLDHPRRVKMPPGPILVYVDAEHSSQRIAVDVRQLFLSLDVATRAAAWHYFLEGQAASLASRTVARLTELRNDLLGTDEKAWRQAAITAHDSVELDLACQLAGARQSIAERYEDGLRYYLPKLLKPDPKSFDSLQVLLGGPERKLELSKLFSESLEKGDLTGVIAEYVDGLGILPFSGDLSFAKLLQEWTKRHPDSNDWRPSIRQWANASNNPILAFYLALGLLEIRDFDAVDAEFIARVLTDVLVEPSTETDSINQRFWTLHAKLAQHYLRHLEVLSPGGLGEPLALAAWWLSSRVASVLCEFPAALSHLDKVAVQPQINSTERSWRFSNPTIQPSVVSTASHWMVSPWPLAALNAMSLDPKRTELVMAAVKDRPAFDAAICRHAVAGCATTIERPSEATYLFELNFADCLGRLQLLLASEEHQKVIEFTGGYYSELANIESFVDKFNDLGGREEFEQLMIVNSARILSFQDRLPLEAVWSKLVDAEWRAKSLSKLSDTAMEILFLTLSRSLKRGGDQWLAGLPHIYALAAEESVGNDERSKFLFALTVFSSMHSYSVSAIERLLRGRNRSKFVEHGRWWKSALSESSQTSPPWVAARIRAVSAAISAAH